jgi:hypothetical protein
LLKSFRSSVLPVQSEASGRLLRVALSLAAAFAITYLIAANILLRTRLLRDLVSQGEGVELDYASAYSVWPGLVHVRGLALQVQDFRIQLSVAADSGVVAICLHDLLFRRFHVRGSRRRRHRSPGTTACDRAYPP